MNNNPKAYGKLCSIFYDTTKTYAPSKEVAFYSSFINQNPGRVLEAMSGSGRLQIPLIQQGYTVAGVDNSSIMISRCRERCAKFGLTPEIYEQSLENLLLPHKYATITIAVGSFQLICDWRNAVQILKNLRAHMQPNGNLLIDIFVPDFTAAQSPYVRIARLDNRTLIRLTTRYFFYEKERIADGFCNYELIVDGVVQEKEDELIQVTWYSDDEFAHLAAQAGLNLIKIYEESFRSSGPSRIAHIK